jgi:hypothetical protein
LISVSQRAIDRHNLVKRAYFLTPNYSGDLKEISWFRECGDTLPQCLHEKWIQEVAVERGRL